jgi:predicted aldo/keto reductase-like oxidoreductase
MATTASARTSTVALVAATTVATTASLLAGLFFFAANKPTTAASPNEQVPACLEESKLPRSVIQLLQDNLDDISDDALIKLVRQLDFWYSTDDLKDNEAALLKLTQKLIDTATWKRHIPDFQVPTVRFGKTELQMPIVTCGGMRFQHTWMPDYLPVLSASKSQVLASKSQNNLTQVVRQCLQVGINHFETARMYGTSEVQLMEAFCELMDSGEIQRSDFILQTKLPTVESRKEFEAHWERSWKIFHKLGYIDLLSFWVVSTPDQVEWVLRDGDDSIMAAALEWQKQGFIKHIGFSTHGTAQNIMQLVNSEKFSYVNIHYHYFGSYHAEGTDDTVGGHGNEAVVKRALELDMGVFNISPIDKGGKLYAPTKQVAQAIGPNLSPISFALLHLWKTSGMHTASVGFARLSDLDEVLEAARIYAKGDFTKLHAAEERLEALKVEKLGKEWMEKGLLNLPDCYDESTELTAIGHVLWLHNVVSAFGMYSFAKDRYIWLEKCAWNKKKSFQENAKKMSAGNMGRSYIPGKDYSEALARHYDSALAEKKLQECHEWLTKGKVLTEEELQERGWGAAYDLTTWHEFPDTNRISISGVILQNVSGGLLGIGGGPSDEVTAYAAELRRILSQD